MMKLQIKKNFLRLTYLTVFTISIISCTSKDDGPSYDTNLVIQSTETNIQKTFTSLTINAKLFSDNGILSKGICWSENSKPTINNNKITETTTTFSSLIDNLNPNTTYYFRVFATTNMGTTYSEEKSFTTLSLGETYWQFSIINNNGSEVLAKVNLFEDGTTKYVEDNCNDCYVPLGSWTVNDNNELTYIGENSDPTLSRHVYYGTISGLTAQGTYEINVGPGDDGTWSATLIP